MTSAADLLTMRCVVLIARICFSTAMHFSAMPSVATADSACLLACAANAPASSACWMASAPCHMKADGYQPGHWFRMLAAAFQPTGTVKQAETLVGMRALDRWHASWLKPTLRTEWRPELRGKLL